MLVFKCPILQNRTRTASISVHGCPFLVNRTRRRLFEPLVRPFLQNRALEVGTKKRVAEGTVPYEVVRPSVTLITRYSVIANGR